MPKVSKYQVLGPYHERSLQGQAKQFCSALTVMSQGCGLALSAGG